MDDLREWDVLVGRVSGRWDKASLKVAPYSSAPGRFKAGAKLCVNATNGSQPLSGPFLLTVRASRKQGKHFILDCDLASSEAADALIGAELFVHPSMRPALPPDEFYLDALLGLRVVTETGEELGEISEVLETPANNVYVTDKAMIPGVPEFIIATDWEARTLTVRDVPGLRNVEP